MKTPFYTKFSLFFVLTLMLVSSLSNAQNGPRDFGILRSTDNGKNWQHVFKSSLDFDHLVSDDKGHILASTMIVAPKTEFSKLYRSSSQPEIWTEVALPETNHQKQTIYDLLTLPNGSVLALQESGIYRTEDGGSTWSTVARILPAKLNSLRIGPKQSILAFSSEDTYQSMDDGSTWHSLGLEGRNVRGGKLLRDGTILLFSNCKVSAYSIERNRMAEVSMPEETCLGYDELTNDNQGNLFANTEHGVYKSDSTGAN